MADPAEFYRELRAFTPLAEVFELLDGVDPCDAFSRALTLVNDCFSPDATKRALSRRKLRQCLETRIRLTRAYEATVLAAAADAGYRGNDFGEALAWCPKHDLREAQQAYRKQLEALR